MCAPLWADPLTLAPGDVALKPDSAWRGSLNGGISEASGNTNSTSINVNGTLQWANSTDKFTSAITGLYGTNTSDGDRSVSDNLATFTGEYDHDLNPQIYTFGLFSAQRNELQDLNFQAALAGGLGYHVVKNGRTSFDAFAGPSYNYEKYKESTRDYPELLLGEDLVQKIGASTSFNERLAAYPNLSYIGHVRTQLDVGLTTAIADRIQLKLTLSNSYQNQPVSGVKKLNTVFMTSIGYTFGPK